MLTNINMTPLAGKKLLLVPLDWGLGHATRCIPIIKELLSLQCDVWLAGERAQEVLLRKEFPGLSFLPLKGYRVKYGSSGLKGKLLWQVPSILQSIKDETKWLSEEVSKYGFEAVISDNRYGLYHKKIFSVLITHQLRIKSPFGKLSEEILQRWNYNFINRFDECWVPDNKDENNLAGELSHPKKLPGIPVKYIGHLSRLEKRNTSEIKNHLLIIVSGPEPQRNLFENKIIDEIIYYPGTVTVVRGLPSGDTILPSTNSIQFYNHMTGEELSNEAAKAEYIISRSGYSTVMDIAALQKKSILVPTPGQTEQEYLAGFLLKKQFAYSINQKEFSLQRSLENARRFAYRLDQF